MTTSPLRHSSSNEDLSPVIVWFRRDLRLSDNHALAHATASQRPVICLYILETNSDLRSIGGASAWWLDKSLRSLNADIAALGGSLDLRRGQSAEILAEVIAETGAGAVYWNRRYNKAGREIDADIKQTLKEQGLDVESFNARLLTEPWTQKTGSGGYYKVFTPYWKAVQANYRSPPVHARPEQFSKAKCKSERLEDWNLHPTRPDWSTGFGEVWQPGETGAQQRLADFLDGPIGDYDDHRDRPDLDHGTSGLSPHLAFGEISPAQIWRAVQHAIERNTASASQAYKFLSEVVWRDFAYVLLFHNPNLAVQNFKADFNHMPWRTDPAALERWQRGQTGYPIVDAGMRQLWHTGWMHNRVRMITASFLTKHLLIDWRCGETWFWDCLVDADPASNSASWQWVAGSGADAAPYFRVFNPISQGQKFDQTGDYVRTWCPELAKLPNKYLHAPWTAEASILEQAGVVLGETYPVPIVDHKLGRERALAAYETLKQARESA